MNKKELTEADIRTKFITPAIVGESGAKWDVMTQLREEIFFTKGRIIVRGKTVKRGEAKKAENVKKRHVFAKYGEKARSVLHALLDKYADSGIRSVESLEILKVDPLTIFGTPIEIVSFFDGKKNYLAAIQELETELYQEAA